MPRSFSIFLILGLLGLGCAMLYGLIGASIDENGVLREPFFLIPVGYGLMFTGAIGATVSVIVNLYRGMTA